MSGFYLMHRGWRSNPVFKDEPCSEREAWLWLIEEAAYQQRRKRVGSTIVTVERGQIATSTRFIAEAWGWTHSKARRFLERLENEAMIGTATDTGVTVITLCNYERFQSPDQATDTPTGTEPTQDRHSTDTNENERNKGKEGKKERGGESAPVADASAAPSEPAPSPAGDLFADPPPNPTPPPAEPKPPKASRLDAGWTLPDEWRDWATEKGASPDAITREAEKFRDYWHAKAGADARKADWYATWRNWMRRSLDNPRSGDRHGSHRQNDRAADRPVHSNAWAAVAQRDIAGRA
ncbi:hypothetical protein [Azospirillum palustre]